jgi:hypothetical protein
MMASPTIKFPIRRKTLTFTPMHGRGLGAPLTLWQNPRLSIEQSLGEKEDESCKEKAQQITLAAPKPHANIKFGKSTVSGSVAFGGHPKSGMPRKRTFKARARIDAKCH